ncbi:MAG: hypothetical protein MJH10_21330, partial [Epibacterium sp.]|nr:hypothetical protein [Epibacterium sp.]NQX75995.1 hypothetical protein [Epibacterium sp.]
HLWTYSEIFSAGDTFNWDGNSHSKHALKGTNGDDGIDPFGGRAKEKITEDGTYDEGKYGVDLGGRGNNSLFNLDKLAYDGKDFSIRLHGVGDSINTAREIFDVKGKKTYVDVTDGAGHLTKGFKDLLDAAFDLGDYADDKDDKDPDGFAGRVLQDGDNFVIQIAAEAWHQDDGAAEVMTFSGGLVEDMMEHLWTYSEIFSAGDTFNWDGNSHSKHALKGTNGDDGIDPFGGRAKEKITEDGTYDEGKYGVDLGGRGNNSLFNLDKLAYEGKDFSIRLHGVGDSINTAREIFDVKGKKTYVDVTDGAGHLTEGFKDLLDAAFDLGVYADAEDNEDSDGFAGRVLHNVDNVVVQIAAEAWHQDDGAAEVMTFSGELAEDMFDYIISDTSHDFFG